MSKQIDSNDGGTTSPPPLPARTKPPSSLTSALSGPLVPKPSPLKQRVPSPQTLPRYIQVSYTCIVICCIQQIDF